jgi:hypothetical protein
MKNKEICLRPEYTICDIRPNRISDDQRDQMASTTLFLARSSILDHTSAASIDYTHLNYSVLLSQPPATRDHAHPTTQFVSKNLQNNTDHSLEESNAD